jgi:hypothetical protein
MRQLEGLAVWCLKFMGGFAALGLGVYYGLLHRALHVPLEALTALVVAHSVLTAACCPFLYVSLKRGTSGLADWRLLFVTVGVYTMVGVPLLLHYLSQFGLIPPSMLRELYLTTGLVIPPGTVAAYYLSRKLSPHLYIRRDTAERGPAGAGPGR